MHMIVRICWVWLFRGRINRMHTLLPDLPHQRSYLARGFLCAIYVACLTYIDTVTMMDNNLFCFCSLLIFLIFFIFIYIFIKFDEIMILLWLKQIHVIKTKCMKTCGFWFHWRHSLTVDVGSHIPFGDSIY